MAATYDHLVAGVELLGARFGFADPGNDQGVRGFGYGWIRRGSAWTHELGLVLLVERGEPGFPYAHVRVDGPTGPADVPCCAFVLDRHLPQPAVARSVPNQVPLTIGAPLSARAGYAVGTAAATTGTNHRYLLTAAHVVAPDGQEVYCGPRRIGVALPTQAAQAGIDIAFVEVANPAQEPALGLLPDGTTCGPPAPFAWDDFASRGAVYLPTTDETASPWILAAGLTLHLIEQDGVVITQTGMVMTESCTQPGDSGTGLRAADGRVIGVLSHGRPDFSFFTSITVIRDSGLWPEGSTI